MTDKLTLFCHPCHQWAKSVEARDAQKQAASALAAVLAQFTFSAIRDPHRLFSFPSPIENAVADPCWGASDAKYRSLSNGEPEAVIDLLVSTCWSLLLDE